MLFKNGPCFTNTCFGCLCPLITTFPTCSSGNKFAVFLMPPEVLGKIFLWNVAPRSTFDGFNEGSHNFLLICHRWLKVALGFLGKHPNDWARQYHLSGTTSLNLVLDDFGHEHEGYFNTTLRSVLQDHVTQDTIRCVHLMAEDPEFLSSVIASLTGMISLAAAFRNPNLITNRNTFPSLENILLGCVDVDVGDRSLLKAFQVCRVSSGNRMDTLQISDYPYMCQ